MALPVLVHLLTAEIDGGPGDSRKLRAYHEAVHAACALTKRAPISVRFGPPVTFARNGFCSPHSLTVAEEILRLVGTLLGERPGRPVDGARARPDDLLADYPLSTTRETGAGGT